MTPEPLRVGEIPYLNMFPLFTSLKNYFNNRDIEFIRGHPAELNLKLRNNLIDVSPSSSIEYARKYARYFLIPDISVSSRRKVKSVILFSPFELEKENDFSIFVTPNSDTSVTLLKIILREFIGIKASVISVKETENMAAKENAPYLLIGDDAIRESIKRERSKTSFQYDLGAMWREFTDLPFVFALWIVNGESYGNRKKAIVKFSRKLLDAKKISLNLIRYRNEKMLAKDAYPWGFLNDYWTNLSYDLDQEMEGLHKFFELSAKIGEIENSPELRFIDLL
jgi:chorismate dehydratase